MTVAEVRSRTFCCCIPVRVGVILLALLGFVGGGFISAGTIIALKSSKGIEKSMALQTAAFIILTLVSLLGLVGGFARKLILVRIYFGLVIFQLAFSVGAGIFAIFRIFKESPSYIQQCLEPDSSDAQIIEKNCKQSLGVVKGLMITAFIVAWLLQMLCCVIVHRYGRQLEEEEETRSMVKDTETW